MQRQMEVMTKVRQDAEDLSGFMRGLEQWHQSVRKEDEALRKSTRTSVPNGTQTKSGTDAKKATIRLVEPQLPASTIASAAQHTHSSYSKWEQFNPETAEEESREVFNTNAAGKPTGSLTPASIAYLPPGAQGSTPAASESRATATLRAGSSNPVLDQAEIERERGNESFRKGLFDSALRAYSRAIGMNPGDFRSLSNRSMAYLKLKNTQAAEDDASAALAIDGSHVKSLYRRGIARVALGRLRDAVMDFEQVLRLDPGNRQAKVELSKCLEQRRTAIRRAPKSLLSGGTVCLDAFIAAQYQSRNPKVDASSGAQSTIDRDGHTEELQGRHSSSSTVASDHENTSTVTNSTRTLHDGVQARKSPDTTGIPSFPAIRGEHSASGRTASGRKSDQSFKTLTGSGGAPDSLHAANVAGAATAGIAGSAETASRAGTSIALPTTATGFETVWRSIGEGHPIEGGDPDLEQSHRHRMALLLRLGPKRFGRLYAAVAPEASMLASIARAAFSAMQVLLQSAGPDKATARLQSWLGALASVPGRGTLVLMLSQSEKATIGLSLHRAITSIQQQSAAASKSLDMACRAFESVFDLMDVKQQ